MHAAILALAVFAAEPPPEWLSQFAVLWRVSTIERGLSRAKQLPVSRKEGSTHNSFATAIEKREAIRGLESALELAKLLAVRKADVPVIRERTDDGQDRPLQVGDRGRLATKRESRYGYDRGEFIVRSILDDKSALVELVNHGGRKLVYLDIDTRDWIDDHKDSLRRPIHVAGTKKLGGSTMLHVVPWTDREIDTFYRLLK